MSSKVQNQNRTFIGKDNFSCSFLCHIKAMDIIMFGVNTVRDSLRKGLYVFTLKNLIFLVYFQ